MRQAVRGHGKAMGRGAVADRGPGLVRPRGFEARRLGTPRPALVEVGRGGRPTAVGRRRVEAVREDWVVEDRWWTDEPLCRRYFELVLEDGRNVVVFHALPGEDWFTQRG